MKNLFSVMASLAILFSMPALAESFAEESTKPEVAEDKQEADTVEVEDLSPDIDAAAPICRGNG